MVKLAGSSLPILLFRLLASTPAKAGVTMEAIRQVDNTVVTATFKHL
jgi:hypothetical protein